MGKAERYGSLVGAEKATGRDPHLKSGPEHPPAVAKCVASTCSDSIMQSLAFVDRHGSIAVIVCSIRCSTLPYTTRIAGDISRRVNHHLFKLQLLLFLVATLAWGYCIYFSVKTSKHQPPFNKILGSEAPNSASSEPVSWSVCHRCNQFAIFTCYSSFPAKTSRLPMMRNAR